MNDIAYAVSVDVNSPIIPYNVYVASVLDSNVRYLEVTLYENGNVIALSNGATATASLVTDNVLVDGSVECTISSNIITVPLEGLQRHGNLDVQVTITEGTKVLAIPFPIQVRVAPNIAENAQIDENSLGSYAEVVHEIAEARGAYTTLHDAIAAKLSAAPGAVDTENLADESITIEKVADDLAAVIDAKEVKSNKKTTLTGNESSNDFYPTTKAVADALNTKVSSLSNRLALHISVGFNANGVPVKFVGGTTISSGAFTNSDVTKIFISQDVQTISNGAFAGCPALSDIYFDSTSTSYDNSTIPSGVTAHTLDNYHIMNCILDCVKYLDDNKVQSISSGRLPTTADSIHYPSVAAVKDFLYANFYTDDEVVTDVIYSDEDLSEYSSVNSTSGRNQACVVIAPNEVNPYFLKSAQVKTKAGTPVKFSVFGISNFYPQDLMNRKRFTKVRDIVVINADDDGVARIEFNLPMRFIPDETALVATCDTSQSSFSYGPYKDAQHTIFNYQSSWFDLQPGESDSWPFPYQTLNNSPYFVLEYVLVSNTTEIKKSAAEILQEQEYFSPYDKFVSDTSTNAVQNKAIYPFIISKDENVVNDDETTYLSAGKYNVDALTHCFAISCEAPTYGTYSVSSIEVRAENDAVITFGLWEMRFIQDGLGYWNLKQVLGTVTAANTRAKLTFQTPIVVDSSNQVIIATCPEKKIAYRSAASNPNPWKHKRVANSVFWYNNNSFSNAQVGDEVNLLLYFGVYKGWDYRENTPNTGAYEITYTPTVPEILTETRTLETCVNGLLSPIGSLRNKVWYCAGDSTTYGIEEGRSYAQIIAERNGMELWKDGISGTVMTSYPDTKLVGAFSFDRYLNIPENVDFVTLWFGINDSTMGYPVGDLDSDDPATFCGAYNKVLTWIINNRPNARVGLVVTHRASDSIKNAIRNLAKKYGFLVFDLQTDPRIPFWHPTDSYYANDVDAAVKTLRTSQWWTEQVNSVHPLTAGYEAISYPFESWLRSL